MSAAEKKGMPCPKVIADRPDLPTHLEYVWNGFVLLNSTRQYGFSSPQPITLSEIECYGRLYGIVGDVGEFIVYIKHMDCLLLEEAANGNRSPHTGKN